MPEPLEQQSNRDVVLEQALEADGPLLKLEQALHRREALILVTSRSGRAHSSLVRTALARFDQAYVVVLISPANAEPILALDRLLETAGEPIEHASGEEKQAALARLIERAAALGRPVVVVVDDAQLATVAQLERLRTALKIDPGANRPVQLILAGTQKLLKKLRKREAQGLWTRVTTQIEAISEPKVAPTIEVGQRQADPQDARPRWPLITAASAGVLAAAMLLIAGLSGRESGEQTPTNTQIAKPSTVVAARSANPPAAPDQRALQQSSRTELSIPARRDREPAIIARPVPESARIAAQTQPLRAVASGAPAGTSEEAAAATASEIGQAADAAGAPKAGAAVPDTSTRAVGAAREAGAVASDTAARAAGGAGATVSSAARATAAAAGASTGAADESKLHVSEWMGVETVRGSGGRRPARRSDASADDTEPTATAEPGEGERAVSAAPARPRRRGAAVVTADGQAPENSRRVQLPPPPRTIGSSGAEPSAKSVKTPVPSTESPARLAALAAATRPAGRFEIQVGAFGKLANATKLKEALLPEFPSVRIEQAVVGGTPFFRVRLGPFPTSGEAAAAEDRLRTRGYEAVRFNSTVRSG